ncbi:cytochrome P450 2D1 [Aplysia californica]|uniref:Cytochrome P450 2D1 n=1 Tax=Aplysia californica TaxID=6500 RepID=A0ABM0JVM7_APLCA|nr:cytochrome P450 2D1 [Aplysia californica]
MISEYALILVALVSILFLALKLDLLSRKKKTTVPGPSLFEGLKDLSQSLGANNLHIVAAKWADKYGDLVSVNAVIRKVVFINCPALARKLVSDPSTRDLSNDRPPTYIGKEVFKGYQDIVTAPYGKDHSKRRRLFHNALKFYGEGVVSFEELMRNTSRQLSERLAKYPGNAPLLKELSDYICWVVGLLLKGEDTSQDDLDSLRKFIDTSNEVFIFEREIFLETFPYIEHVPGLKLKELVKGLKESNKEIKDKFLTSVRETYKKGGRTGIITDLLEQQEQLEKKGNVSDMSDEIVLCLILDIVAAANVTTAGTLTALFLLLIVNPKIQERIYAEICEVIGNDPPSFDHKRQMPYTEAVILETLRYSSVAPFLLPHYATDDINFEGHFIPKGTFLLLNSWYFHRREDLWDKPWTFNPDRFLDANGQLLPTEHPTRQNLVAFGTGRRACPGESFARVRMFFIVVTLVQQFRFLPPVGEELPSANPETWETKSVMLPHDYSCRVERRSAAENEM